MSKIISRYEVILKNSEINMHAIYSQTKKSKGGLKYV